MILYKLTCSNEHAFDAWFRDSATYDKQAKAGDVDCPFCGDTSISKAPMAPRLARSPKTNEGKTGTSSTNMVEAAAAAEKAAAAANDGRAVDVAEQILKAVNMLRDYVERNYENVGEDFADEARRIHYGEAEERGIYGEASEEDTEALVEEGIEHVRLPRAPGKSN